MNNEMMVFLYLLVGVMIVVVIIKDHKKGEGSLIQKFFDFLISFFHQRP